MAKTRTAACDDEHGQLFDDVSGQVVSVETLSASVLNGEHFRHRFQR